MESQDANPKACIGAVSFRLLGKNAAIDSGRNHTDPIEKQAIPLIPSEYDCKCYHVCFITPVVMFSEILTQMLWQKSKRTLLQEVMRLDLPMCHQIREDLLGGVTFPLLSANVM